LLGGRNARLNPLFGGRNARLNPLFGGRNATLNPLFGGRNATLNPLFGGRNARLNPLFGGRNATLNPLFGGRNATLNPLFGGRNATLNPLFGGRNARLNPLFGGRNARLNPLFGGRNARLNPLFGGRNAESELVSPNQSSVDPRVNWLVSAPTWSDHSGAALVARTAVVATVTVAKISNSFFLIQATPITGCIGKGYRILVFIENTILANEAPLPEMHKSTPRMGNDFALATDSVAILRLKRNFAPLIIFIH
jgi:hypothetical protein